MIQIKEQSHQEKVDMYMLLSKEQLIEMLIEANRHLWRVPPIIEGIKTGLEYKEIKGKV